MAERIRKFRIVPSSMVLNIKGNTTIQILKQLTLFLLLFFFKFPFFRVFVFCISSNKLNSISCEISLSFKSCHLELFCKIIIQLSSTGIFLGLWSRGLPCNFTEELFFLYNCEWLLPII